MERFPVATTPGGKIELGSVLQGEVTLTPGDRGFSFGYAKMPNLGNIQITGAADVDVTGTRGGEIQINAEKLQVSDRARIIEINAGLVEVRGSSPDGGLSKSSISAFNAGLSGRGVGGSININADKLIVRDAGRVNAESRGNGDAGNLQITAKEILVDNGGRLTAETVGGERGNIFLNANSIIMQRVSNITTKYKPQL